MRQSDENVSFANVAVVTPSKAGIHHHRPDPRLSFVSESKRTPVARRASCSAGPSRPTIPDHAKNPAVRYAPAAAPPTTTAEATKSTRPPIAAESHVAVVYPTRAHVHANATSTAAYHAFGSFPKTTVSATRTA